MWPACPCKECTERSIGCHSKCGGYKEFTEKINSDKKKQREFLMNTYWGKVPGIGKRRGGTR